MKKLSQLQQEFTFGCMFVEQWYDYSTNLYVKTISCPTEYRVEVYNPVSNNVTEHTFNSKKDCDIEHLLSSPSLL